MVYALSLNFFANVPTLYFKVYIVTCGRCEGDDIIGMDWRVLGYVTFNFQTPPPARRPPPPLLEAAAAYYIIVSICQMMAMAYDTYAPQSFHQYVHYEGFTYMAER